MDFFRQSPRPEGSGILLVTGANFPSDYGYVEGTLTAARSPPIPQRLRLGTKMNRRFGLYKPGARWKTMAVERDRTWGGREVGVSNET